MGERKLTLIKLLVCESSNQSEQSEKNKDESEAKWAVGPELEVLFYRSKKKEKKV